MGRRRYYSGGAVNRALCPSDRYRTQPEGQFVGVIRTEQKWTRATCQEKSANREGLHEDIVEFLICKRVVSGCALLAD
jgi:hypothetical protein